MSTASIIQCDCGARVRLPRDGGNRAFRCPKCKAGIALTVDAHVLSTTRLSPGDAGVTCPICQTAIAAEETCVECPRCQQVHHRECWSEIGGCGTYGCEEAPRPDKDGEGAPQPLAAWGDTKQCPACGEEIKSIALRCRYCGTDFDTVDPLSTRDLRRLAEREQETKRLRQAVVAIFAVSLIGCLAPLMLAVGLAVLVPKHEQLAKTGPVYAVMGWAAVGLSALYSVLMVFFIAFQ